MQSWAEKQLVTLRPNYPGWDLWIVQRWPVGETWCARPVGAPAATINVNTPEELVEAIRRQQRAALQCPE
jgi:hypothetical protein